MTRAAALSIASVCLVSACVGDEVATSCEAKVHVVDSCSVVHGRLQAANGSPAFRIWVVGSKRILGVGGGEGSELAPKALLSLLGDNRVVFGDFRVCPMTKDASGAMQMVCVESGKRLVHQVTTPTGRTVARLPDVSAQTP